jgi:hypothetical protein
MFMMFACTLGQTPAKQSAAASTIALQPTETRVAGLGATNPPTLQTGPRRPHGIYAELHVELEIAREQKANPSITPAELHAYFGKLYNSILDNPAVSGLAVGITWGILNPNAPPSPQAYDWSYMDDAFNSVEAWNAANPAKLPKTVQVQMSAGFGTPQWVIDQLPSCDGLFQSPPQTPVSNCGKATFLGFVEGGGGVLPMPWNPFYKSSFKTFLTAFAARYSANPAFVSMDISGPTAASTEMMEPTDTRTPAQAQFGGISANTMWLRLLAFAYRGKPAYQNSDQAFIDEWNTATDMFGQIFSGVTLVATTGSGLPNFGSTGITVPPAFKADCRVPPDMDCAAEMTILAHFVDPSVAKNDAKATQESGLDGVSGGVAAGVKRRAQMTGQLSAPGAQILGGLQFGTSLARETLKQGCTSRFPPEKDRTAGSSDTSSVPIADIPQACLAPGVTSANLASYRQSGDVPASDLISPEQGLYNVLRNYFDGTPAASAFGGSPGTAPMNYLQIYVADFQYAAAHVNAPARVMQTDGTTVMMTAQDLLNLASQKLLEIGEPTHSP